MCATPPRRGASSAYGGAAVIFSRQHTSPLSAPHFNRPANLRSTPDPQQPGRSLIAPGPYRNLDWGYTNMEHDYEQKAANDILMRFPIHAWSARPAKAPGFKIRWHSRSSRDPRFAQDTSLSSPHHVPLHRDARRGRVRAVCLAWTSIRVPAPGIRKAAELSGPAVACRPSRVRGGHPYDGHGPRHEQDVLQANRVPCQIRRTVRKTRNSGSYPKLFSFSIISCPPLRGCACAQMTSVQQPPFERVLDISYPGSSSQPIRPR